MRRRDRVLEAMLGAAPTALLAYRDPDWPQARQLDRMLAWSDARAAWQSVSGHELPPAQLPDADFDPRVDL